MGVGNAGAELIRIWPGGGTRRRGRIKIAVAGGRVSPPGQILNYWVPKGEPLAGIQGAEPLGLAYLNRNLARPKSFPASTSTARYFMNAARS
jgi:hypothetical protein